MKREKYGYIYRTHLFGNRTVRVTGADNVKQILLGEHRLVSAQWPASVRAILGTETLSNMHGAQHKTKKKVSYFDLSVEGALATAGGVTSGLRPNSEQMRLLSTKTGKLELGHLGSVQVCDMAPVCTSYLQVLKLNIIMPRSYLSHYTSRFDSYCCSVIVVSFVVVLFFKETFCHFMKAET